MVYYSTSVHKATGKTTRKLIFEIYHTMEKKTRPESWEEDLGFLWMEELGRVTSSHLIKVGSKLYFTSFISVSSNVNVRDARNIKSIKLGRANNPPNILCFVLFIFYPSILCWKETETHGTHQINWKHFYFWLNKNTHSCIHSCRRI